MSSANRGECETTGGLNTLSVHGFLVCSGPLTCVLHTSNCTKNLRQFFLWCGKSIKTIYVQTVSKSPLSIILCSQVIPFESGEKYTHIKHCLQAKTNMWLDFDVRGQQGINFLQEEAYFGKKWPFKVKILWWICFFVLQTHYLMNGSGVDYCVQIILLKKTIHWWANDGMLHFSTVSKKIKPNSGGGILTYKIWHTLFNFMTFLSGQSSF